MNKSQFQNLNITLIFCRFLGIMTPDSKSLFFKVIYAFLLSGMMVGYVYSSHGKMFVVGYNPVIKLTDQIASFFLTLTCETTSLMNIFVYPLKIAIFMKQMKKYNEKVRIDSPKLNLIFWICLIGVHVIVLVTVMMDSYVWLSIHSFDLYKLYVLRNIQYYKMAVTAFLVFWVTLEAHYRFENLNDWLKKIFSIFRGPHPSYVISKHLTKTQNEKNIMKDLKNIVQLHNQLCTMIEQYSGMFGTFILFSVLFTIIFSVQYTTSMVYWEDLSEHVTSDYGRQIQIVCSFWVINNFVSIKLNKFKILR